MATADELSQIADLDDRVAAMMAAMEEATAQVSKVFEPTTDEIELDDPAAAQPPPTEAPPEPRATDQSEPDASPQAEADQPEAAGELPTTAPNDADDSLVETSESVPVAPTADASEDVIPGNIRTLDEELAQVAEHFIEGSFDEGEAESPESADPSQPVATLQTPDTPDDQPGKSTSAEPHASESVAHAIDEPPPSRAAPGEKADRILPYLLHVARLRVSAAMLAADRLLEGRPPIIRRAVGWFAIATTVYAALVWAVVLLRATSQTDRSGQRIAVVEPD